MVWYGMVWYGVHWFHNLYPCPNLTLISCCPYINFLPHKYLEPLTFGL